MSDIRQRLTTALLRLGQQRLAEIWKCDASEAGRRLNGQRNIPFDDFATALDALGIDLATPDQNAVIVPKDEWNALRTLARKSLDSDD
jgi:hypothetical protein